jgi:hypothetical protein
MKKEWRLGERRWRKLEDIIEGLMREGKKNQLLSPSLSEYEDGS